MNNPRHLELLLFVATLSLLTIGIMSVYSASWPEAIGHTGDAMFYGHRHAIFAGLGVCAMMCTRRIQMKWLLNYHHVIAGAVLLGLLAVLIPGVGKSVGGAQRWLILGGFRFQPGEFAKIMVCLWLAARADSPIWQAAGGRRAFFITWSVPFATMVLLMLEPDFGTTVMVTLICGLFVFLRGLSFAALGGGLLSIILLGTTLIVTSPYRMRRLLAFFDPWEHRFDVGYQITQSLVALGRGGLLGVGFGEGRQKLFFLPAIHTDFILSNIGEELGFVGVLFVLAMFAVVAVAGIHLIKGLEEHRLRMLASLLLVLIMGQAVFNIAVVLGLVPTKGITLPFVSRGGSALIGFMIVTGMLLSLSQNHQKNTAGSEV